MVSSFERSLNATFIVLVTTKRDAIRFKGLKIYQFGGGLYKLLAKVFGYRLKKVVGKVVSTS